MVCNDPITAAVCQQAAEAAADQAGSFGADLIGQLAEGTGDVAAFLVKNIWTLMETTTMVDLRTGEFTAVYNLVFGIAVFLMLGFFLLQLITGMLRREPGALARALGGLAKSVLGSFVVITITALLLEITDQVCLAIVRATGTSMEAMGAELAIAAGAAVGGTLIAPMAGSLLSLFLAGLAVGAALIVWFSLLMRKALLLVAVALGPLALAGASWDATRGWVSKWAQFVVALILSKLVLVVVFLLATTLTASPISGDLASLTDKLAGIALLFVAGFAPYMTYKAISFMGFDMYHAMSVEQEAKAAVNRPMPLQAGPAIAGGIAGRNVQRVFGPDGGSGGAGSRGAAGGAGAHGAVGTPGAVNGAGGGSGAAASAKGAAGAKAAAATGPAAAVAVPVAVAGTAAKGAATAGPKLGAAAGEAAAAQHGAASSGQPSPGTRTRTAPTSPPAAPPVRDVPTVLRDRGDKR